MPLSQHLVVRFTPRAVPRAGHRPALGICRVVQPQINQDCAPADKTKNHRVGRRRHLTTPYSITDRIVMLRSFRQQVEHQDCANRDGGLPRWRSTRLGTSRFQGGEYATPGERTGAPLRIRSRHLHAVSRQRQRGLERWGKPSSGHLPLVRWQRQVHPRPRRSGVAGRDATRRLSGTTVSKLKRLRHMALTLRLGLVAPAGAHLAVDAAGRY